MPLKLVKRASKGGFVYYVRGTVKAPDGRTTRCFESTGTDRKDLADAYRIAKEGEIYERLVHGERDSVAWATAARSYLEHEDRSDHTLTYVGNLTLHLGVSPLMKRDDRTKEWRNAIDQTVADELVRKIVGADAAPATKRRIVYVPLAAVLNHAAHDERRWCDRPNFDLPRVPQSETNILTPREALRLLGASAAHLRVLALFLLGTGARLSEALDLEWPDVRLDQSKARLRATKGRMGQKKDRWASLPSAVVAALSTLPHRSGKVFLHPEYYRLPDGSAAVRMVPYADRERKEGGQIGTAFEAACRRAGLCRWMPDRPRAHRRALAKYAGPYTPIKSKAIVTPHDLRHTWASWWYCIKPDPMLLRDEGCWSSLDMVGRYAHLAPPEMADDVHLVWGASHPRLGVLPRANAVHGGAQTA